MISGPGGIMECEAAFLRFARLFIELDGDLKRERQDVTERCVEALFDRIMNPATLETEDPVLEDVDATVGIIADLVERVAARFRKLVAEGYPPSADNGSLQDDGLLDGSWDPILALARPAGNQPRAPQICLDGSIPSWFRSRGIPDIDAKTQKLVQLRDLWMAKAMQAPTKVIRDQRLSVARTYDVDVELTERALVHIAESKALIAKAATMLGGH